MEEGARRKALKMEEKIEGKCERKAKKHKQNLRTERQKKKESQQNDRKENGIRLKLKGKGYQKKWRKEGQWRRGKK